MLLPGAAETLVVTVYPQRRIQIERWFCPVFEQDFLRELCSFDLDSLILQPLTTDRFLDLPIVSKFDKNELFGYIIQPFDWGYNL